jgi:sulfur carrier protein ThiS
LKIHVQLYSVLRDKLPPEAKGRTTLKIDSGATLTDLLAKLDINRKVVISVNEDHETDKTRRLQAGDVVKIFSSISGG